MQKEIHQTIISFPEIRLFTRDAHKLRGYFGSLFKLNSPLLHNHLDSGESLYQYPLVQYKVIHGIPTLVGLNEGADLLINLFLKIKELIIDKQSYPVMQKNIESKIIKVGLTDDLHNYQFETLWMALNQKNYNEFLKEDEKQRSRHLKAVLIGNILSFYKALDLRVEQTVMANLKIAGQSETHFKDNSMLAFKGQFVTNASLPEYVGLGKSVSRGFGTVKLIS